MGPVSFLLAHLSDPHLGPLPTPRARDLMGKRLTGFLNWRRRKSIHDMDMLARVVADMRAQKPDHVMMTGDALNIGLPGEFEPAAAWLGLLGESQHVSFVPGNHDAYVGSSLPRVATTFGPWMLDDGGKPASWPYLRQRGGVALIGVNSGVPTAPFLASGKVGGEQLARLAWMLEDARARELMRVVMIHHPPWRGGATPGRGLRDARAFEKVIATHGAELIVHGHNHRTSVHRLPSRDGSIPVIGVRSASAVPGTARHLAGYHLYRVEKHAGGWSIDARARGLATGSNEIVDLGPITL
jgi:3',5'-cyclic AMP phosphodiesterase CpdA